METVSQTALAHAPEGGWRTEWRAMILLALPLALVQLGQLAIHTTEVLLLGRLSAERLAGVTLAWSLFQPAFMIAIGITQATAPLVAQALGAGNLRDVRRAVRQGLWVSLCIFVPLGLLLWHAKPLFLAIGQDAALLDDTETYLRSVLWGLPFGAGFVVLRSLTSAYGRTRAVLVITGVAIVFNLVLSYGLIFGAFGLPGLEVLGAGLGAAISWAFMFLGLLAYCLLRKPFSELALLGRFWVPDWRSFFEVWRLGLPIAGAFLLETGTFAAATLMMGRFGTAELAAHQVTLQLAATSFMVPLGIGIAATTRIGLAVGRRDGAAVRRAGVTALAMGTGFMAVMAIIFWTNGAPLVDVFFGGDDPHSLRAATLALSFLHVAAWFQLFDAIQVVGISALRGLRDTTIPMWLAGLGYWGIGMPFALALGFLTPLAGVGIWIGLAISLAVVALAMLYRFARLSRPARLDPLLRHAAPADLIPTA